MFYGQKLRNFWQTVRASVLTFLNMNFWSVLSIVLALFALAMGQNCPAKFDYDSDKKLCTAERPVHGSCPEGSLYDVNFNKCVYVLRN
uniref:Chitin-binding type-2 domain-containing protein n=1 Tax=Glossina palpalis gambiensis TaxID=67801 RepID=A0A1B0BEX7_9MUSC